MPRAKREATEKFSMYFPRELHEKISALARYQDKKINDIFTELAREYVNRNIKRLELFEQAKQQADQLDAVQEVNN